ncbi:archaea-specific SMC-related protein [Halalkalicoccus ordinarius]|uniref:archaea-specific SMC-related protein n=1 Tax=Halalkalicoccus ordinarius TaxID=3116651 RepID=UPI00300F5AD6
MSPQEHPEATIHAENVGGITSTTVEFGPGVTALAGRNATNRTSLLQAIMAALGSERASLKGDAASGRAELELGERIYTRELTRTNGTLHFEGDPYLEDPQIADLFAFLLESNAARRAVVRGDDLRELILRPVDVESIETTIERLQAEKRDVSEELAELSAAGRELRSLEEDRTRVRSELEEAEADLERARETLEGTRRSEDGGTSERFDALQEARTTLEDVTYDLETERASVDSLEAERTELRESLGDRSVAEEETLDELASRIERLRGRKGELDEIVSQLQTVIQFNENLADAEYPELIADGDEEDGVVTDRLLSDRSTEVTCWTCGSTVETDRIESTLSELRELRREKLEQRNEIDAELDSLKRERADYRETREERDRLERKLETVESELEDRNERIEELETRRGELLDEIEALEREVEDDGDDAELLSTQKAVTRHELERDRLEREFDAIEGEIDEIESRLEKREELETRREEIREELEEQRTRIERIEREAIGAFNEHMNTVLGLLEYANLERIWLERLEPTTGEEATFDLHITRITDEGTTYEDSVDHLSESEREVTGLIVALAGYLVHDVHERVPFMLLDSLEALDSERIAALIDYLDQYAPYVVVALLPEDAAALDDSYTRITEI